MARIRSRVVETESVNQRMLRRGAVKRQHISPWAVGHDELAPGVVGDTHLHPSTLETIREIAADVGVGETVTLIASGVIDGGFVEFDEVDEAHRRAGFESLVLVTVGPTASVLGYYDAVIGLDFGEYAEATVRCYVGSRIVWEHTPDHTWSRASGAVPLGVVDSGDQLKVWTDHPGTPSGSVNFRLVDTPLTAAPAETPTTPVQIQLTGDARDFEFDGGVFWVANRVGKQIVQATPTGTVVSTIATGDGPDVAGSGNIGLAVVGSEVWVSFAGDPGDSRIDRYTTAGAFVGTFNIANTQVRGIAHDGTNLWATGSGGTPSLLKCNATTGAIVNSYALPSRIGSAGTFPGDGLEFHDGALYLADRYTATITRFDLSGVEQAYIDSGLPTLYLTGVTVDADLQAWVVQGDGIIHPVSLP